MSFTNFERRNAILDLIFFLKFKEPKKAEYIDQDILNKFDENYYKNLNQLYRDLKEIVEEQNFYPKNKSQRFYRNLLFNFLNKFKNQSLHKPKKNFHLGLFLVPIGIGTIFFASFATLISVVSDIQESAKNKAEKQTTSNYRTKIYPKTEEAEKQTASNYRPEIYSKSEEYANTFKKQELAKENEDIRCRQYWKNATLGNSFYWSSERYHLSSNNVLTKISSINHHIRYEEMVRCKIEFQKVLNKEYAFGNKGNIEIYTIEDGDLIRYVKRTNRMDRYNFSKGDGYLEEGIGGFIELFTGGK